jgi:hypothetical protein
MKTEVQEQKYDNTNLWDELIFIKDAMKEARAKIEEIKHSTEEAKGDCAVMAREILVYELAKENDFTDYEKRIANILLSPYAGEEALTAKFNVLTQLLYTIRLFTDILGEIEEENKEGEFENKDE